MNDLLKRSMYFKGLSVRFFAEEGEDEGGQDTGGGGGGTMMGTGGDSGAEGGGEFNISSFIDTDGSFKEGWQNGLVDEASRSQGIYNRVSDIKGLLQVVGEQEKTLSKKGIVPLSEKPSPGELSAYRAAMGVPETVDGYGFKPPEGLEQYYSDPVVQQSLKELHEANLTPKQLQTVMAADQRRLGLIAQAQQDALQEKSLKAEMAIDKLFGSEKDTHLRTANLAIKEITKSWTPEEREALFGTESDPKGINLPEHSDLKPMLFKMLSEIGGYFKEDGGLQIGQIADSDSLDNQIGAITAQLSETLQRTDRKKYNELIEQRDALYKKRYPDK